MLTIQGLRNKPFPKTSDPTALAAYRRERHKKIIALATEVITATLKDPKQQKVFDEAAMQLMEARLNLALQGDEEARGQLYENAAAFYERDAESEAAVTSAIALTRYVHTNARRYGKKEPRWLEELSRQARLFATNFPKEEFQSVSLLYAAGRSCELHGLTKEAISCYELISKLHPESDLPQAQHVPAFLRRLNLQGKPLQLAGPTIDGGFISVDDFKNKVVLVVFWSSENESFQKDVAAIHKITTKYKKFGLEVIGVNLDEEEPNVEAFLEKYPLTWKQIFYSDPAKRRWNTPVVKYYGVRELPMMWLVDHHGNVADTKVKADTLEKQVRELLLALREKK